MGSSKKHKKHKSERREKYEEYSNNMDPAQLQRGLKLILKVGSNSTPEYSGDSTMAGPPTAAEAMMATAPSSPAGSEDLHVSGYRERHKKSKKKKKKKDREKKHKHHKKDRHRHRDDSIEGKTIKLVDENKVDTVAIESANEGEPSQDGFPLVEVENVIPQPLPKSIAPFYANMSTSNSPSCRPVSKPIVPRKEEDVLIASPISSEQLSPTKSLPELLIPSPSASTNASTPGIGSALTPKMLEGPKTPSSSSESGREPRTCVLKLKQQKSPLNKLLDHLLRLIEKRDPHQFFAWPVTDDIAPGYSSIITKPMDFSTMRQKIDDGEYTSLTEFTDDFKLMCDNAIRYNHVDTVYHKAAKRLLQVGMKQLSPETLMRSYKPLSSFMRELSTKELGFEMLAGEFGGSYDQQALGDSADEGASTGADEPTPAQLEKEEKRRALREENEPKSRFEPYVDDLTSEEILAQVQGAAQAAKQRLTAREKAHKMGFLRQNKNGTTSLNFLIKDDNEGPERVVTIGELVGKLESGSGQLQNRPADIRNNVKLVKPLNYGPFSSFAPSFDSRFSHLTKEETQLLLSTYGEATCAEYAESILQFTKDSDYPCMLANGLLDILTNGEHSKTIADLYDMQIQNYEQKEVRKCFSKIQGESREEIEADYEKYKNTRIDFKRLRTLSEFGIDVAFLDEIESEMKHFELSRRLQEHLSSNLSLIEKLSASQNERLSQPLPKHLAHVQPPSDQETHLAHQITQQLTDVVMKLPPSATVDPYGLRKAMGMSYVGLPPPPQPSQRLPVPELLQQPVSMPQLQLTSSNMTTSEQNNAAPNVSISNDNPAASAAASATDDAMPMDIDEDVVGSASGVDLENELREFLEGETGLHATSSNDENNIVAQLLMD